MAGVADVLGNNPPRRHERGRHRVLEHEPHRRRFMLLLDVTSVAGGTCVAQGQMSPRAGRGRSVAFVLKGSGCRIGRLCAAAAPLSGAAT